MSDKIWKTPHPSGAEIWTWCHTSQLLADNSRYKQNPVRFHAAFIPHEAATSQLPVLYCLAPWMSSGRSMFQWEAFREDLPTRLVRLMATGQMDPCIVVCPDLYTEYGGSQFIDSSWVGPHASVIVREIIPWVEQHLPVLAGLAHRGVFGRSSGGFGALRLVMDFPGVFSAVGCHAGDMGFEWVYRKSLVDLCTALVKFNHPLEYLAWTNEQKKLSGWDTHILMLLGMCAFYSPNPKEPWGFDLPIDLKTAEIDEKIYARWLQHDPVELAKGAQVQNALSELKTIFIDCGNRDQYYLHFGARRLSKILRESGIKHIYKEFDDNHSGTAYRYDESLPRLVAALS
jgi:enterochelin esterase-like enzyme